MKSDRIINFGEILKKAWQYVWKYKYLWLLGILAGSGSGASSNNFSWMTDPNVNPNNWKSESLHNLPNNIPSVGKVLGAASPTVSSFDILIITLIALVLCLIVIYLNITARGAIISAVDKIEQNNKFSLANSWSDGHKYFWRMLGFSILLALMVIVPMLFLAAPIVIMVVVRWYIPAIIVGILFLLILFIYLIYLSLSAQYGQRILVLESQGSWASIKRGADFFNKNWKNVMLAYLILIAIMIGASVALAIGLFIIGGTIFGVVFGLYFVNHIIAIIVGIPLGLALFIALLIASGIISSYQSTLITLVYKEIKSID